MRKKLLQFPVNDPKDIGGIIRSYLRDAGITAHIGILKNNFTITTDEKVPEEIMSIIRMSVESRGYTIKFLTP